MSARAKRQAEARPSARQNRPRPRPARPRPPGDAAALLGLLQRQHPSLGPIPSIPGAANAPALAIISALAALLQPKSPGARRSPSPSPRAGRRPSAAPSSGAEIVVLRPHANAAAQEALAARDGDNVALTSQERDAFKEIARALGANVRSGRPNADAPLGAAGSR